jgi:hypothetical protein
LRRLEKRILVPLPSKEAREAMMRKLVPSKMSDSLNYDGFSELLEVSLFRYLTAFRITVEVI